MKVVATFKEVHFLSFCLLGFVVVGWISVDLIVFHSAEFAVVGDFTIIFHKVVISMAFRYQGFLKKTSRNRVNEEIKQYVEI